MSKFYFRITLAIVAASCVCTSLAAQVSASECDLQKSPPEPLGDLKNFASLDNSSLANIDAYLIYHPLGLEKKDRYLPLKLESFHLTYWQDPLRMLKFVNNCGHIGITLVASDSIYRVTYIQTILPSPYGGHTFGDTDQGLEGLTTSASKHYSCSKPKSYPLIPYGGNYDRRFITLVINKLEFEVDGDKKQISQGHFSTPAGDCQ